MAKYKKKKFKKYKKYKKQVKKVYKPKSTRYKSAFTYRKNVGMMARSFGYKGAVIIPGIAPLNSAVRFRICETLTLTGTGTPTIVNEITPSNILDPLQTFGAVKPTGWTENIAFYEKYRLTNVRVYCTFWMDQGSIDAHKPDLAFGILPASATGQIATSDVFSVWCHWPRQKHVSKPGTIIEVGTAANEAVVIHGRKYYLSANLNPKTFFKEAYDTGVYDVLTAGTAPTNKVFFNILCSDVQGGNLTNSLIFANVHLEIVMEGFFFDRKELGTS